MEMLLLLLYLFLLCTLPKTFLTSFLICKYVLESCHGEISGEEHTT